MRVRATRPFSAYRPENCTIITAAVAGEELSDPATARYLIETNCPDIEPADDDAAALIEAGLAARYVVEPNVTGDAQPVNTPVGDAAPAVVGEAGPELVVAGGVAVARAPATDPTPYNATIEHPSQGGTTPAEPAEPDLEVASAGDSAPEAAWDPAEHTVDEVLEYVDANPSQAAAVLALETADDGKQRVTIVKALAG